jgi:RNA 2',3'-cyclic 3'-phosphodiesterase
MSAARLFFALWPDSFTRAAIAGAVAPIVREVTGRGEVGAARAVPTANYHFTVAFLGAVPLTDFERLCLVAEQTAEAYRRSGLGPIAVTVDTLEHWRKPQVLVATSPTASPSAAALAARLTHALTGAGFAPDSKPFRPHLTLARKVTVPFAATSLPTRGLTFRDFALVESRARPAGVSYVVLRTFRLCDTDVTGGP